MFEVSYRKYLIQKVVCWEYSGKDVKLKIIVLACSTFHNSSLEQVTYLTISFCQFGCEPELHMEVNFVCSIEQDDAFQEGWMWLGDEKNFDLSFHKSVVTELATCGISGIDKLFDDSEVGSNEGEEVGYECEAGPVQSFTKVHSAYETAMSFFMHHTNEHNRIFFLGSGTLFHIKCEVSTKQLLVADSVERRDWHT